MKNDSLKSKIVLQKFIAESGYCSRRQAEELIRLKKVLVNNEPAELGMKVDEGDEVKVNGRKLALSKEKIYIILNKPKGYTCTNRQFEGEKNVFELVDVAEKLFTVGRLDKDSRGLVLITNDGDLTQKLTHPKFEHEKKYIIKIQNLKINPEHSGQNDNLKLKIDGIVKKLMKGVDIGDGDGIVKVKDIKYIGDNNFEIILTEGKKRQIRRMFRAVGCEIKDLIRIGIGSLSLGNLAEGRWRKVDIDEIQKVSEIRN
jgi:pseudouridine synthase